jgi:hypothetical protein
MKNSHEAKKDLQTPAKTERRAASLLTLMMTKRSSLIYLLLAPAVLLLLLLAVAIFRKTGNNDAPALNAKRFREEWSALQGNAYALTGQIDQQLGYHAENGRVLSIRLLADSERLPVLVPPSMTHNFEPGQRYAFKVRVRGDSLLVENADKY